MSEPGRRKRFQMHLSTAVVLMFVAGLLIRANVRERNPFEPGIFESIKGVMSLDEPLEMYANPAKSPNPFIGWERGFGWPKVAYYLPDRYFRISMSLKLQPEFQVNYELAAIDVACAVLILAAVWLTCEWRIRRRPARKGT